MELRARLADLYCAYSDVLDEGELDFALMRRVPLHASTALELRVEVFNLLNRANFDLPNRTYGNANFGRIFSAKSPREMQVGVRLMF